MPASQALVLQRLSQKGSAVRREDRPAIEPRLVVPDCAACCSFPEVRALAVAADKLLPLGRKGQASDLEVFADSASLAGLHIPQAKRAVARVLHGCQRSAIGRKDRVGELVFCHAQRVQALVCRQVPEIEAFRRTHGQESTIAGQAGAELQLRISARQMALPKKPASVRIPDTHRRIVADREKRPAIGPEGKCMSDSPAQA